MSAQEKKEVFATELPKLKSKLVEVTEEVSNVKWEKAVLHAEGPEQRKVLEQFSQVSVLAVEE